MMQQMYAHYMAQYMQYVQSGGMWPSYNVNGTNNENTAQAGADQLNQQLQNQENPFLPLTITKFSKTTRLKS